MKVCGINAPLPAAPAVSMKLLIESVHPPIIGTRNPSFSLPAATAASSGPMPQMRIACAPDMRALMSWALISLSPMANFSTSTTLSRLP